MPRSPRHCAASSRRGLDRGRRARLVGDGLRYCYLQDVLVDPEFSDQGIASTLVERLLAWIASQGSAEVFVGLFSSPEAEGVYESLGFAASSDMTGMHRWVRPGDNLAEDSFHPWTGTSQSRASRGKALLSSTARGLARKRWRELGPRHPATGAMPTRRRSDDLSHQVVVSDVFGRRRSRWSGQGAQRQERHIAQGSGTGMVVPVVRSSLER